MTSNSPARGPHRDGRVYSGAALCRYKVLRNPVKDWRRSTGNTLLQGQDYVRTVWAKGLQEQTVVLFHAVRNALIPVVTIVALQIPEIVGGAIITEQIFQVPGIGSALLLAINGGDRPTVMAIVFGIAILVVIFNVIADIIYEILDPRIKLS
jgi:peptide/nickel transport system permease protein